MREGGWAAAWKRAARFERNLKRANNRAAWRWYRRAQVWKRAAKLHRADAAAYGVERDRLRAALDAIYYGDIVPVGEYRAWAKAAAGRALGVADVLEVGGEG